MDDVAQTAPAVSRADTATDYIARARALVPLLRSAAGRIDAACKLPDDVVQAMHDAQMWRLLIPRVYGGAELDPVMYVQCVEQIASGDASAAWCMNQGSGCSMTAAYMAPAVSQEIWGPREGVLAWGQQIGCKAIRTEGGWIVSGTWCFMSGMHNATWLGMHAPCFNADGTPQVHPNGTPWERTMLIPKERTRIEIDWQVLGLRGTGSDRFTVENVFIDDAHSVTRDSPAERRESGMLYRFASMQLYAAGFASVGLGVARATLDAFIELARKKTASMASHALHENAAVQSILGHADARWKAARAGLHTTLVAAQESVKATGELSVEHRIAIRQASTFAIHESRAVVHDLYHEAGATAIFNSHPFERRLRDINSVSQQTQGRRSHFEAVGHFLLGGSPSLRWV
jgi:alkylation response protein AidB-like acyl-CoA dehydrogenase